VSTRRVTRQQFSPQTTIDGNRLDAAWADATEKANAVPRGDQARRYVQSQVVMGWTPNTGNSWFDFPLIGNPVESHQDALPFMPIYNDLAAYIQGAPPAQGVQNPWRIKGTYNPGALPADDHPAVAHERQTILAWTTALKFGRSVTLQGIHMDLWANPSPPLIYTHTPSPFNNGFTYNDIAPPGKTLHASVDDVILYVAVDNPFLPEAERLSSMVVHKYQFRADSGLPVNERQLNIAVPENGRVRCAICIPWYPWQDYSAAHAGQNLAYYDGTGWTQNNGTSAWAGSLIGVPPWANQVYSSTLTFDEPCEA